MEKGFYYIENTVDEWHSSKSAFLETLEEAKEAIKHFSDWYGGKGTGKIYFQPFGTKEDRTSWGTLYTHGMPRRFICRGMGVDEKGNVEFSEKEY